MHSAMVMLALAAFAAAAPLPPFGGEVEVRQEARAQIPEAEKIDVNSADHEALETVPGIGPAMAGRIIDWRQTQGAFESLDDLLNIRGIGTTTLEKLRPYLKVVRPAKTSGAD